MSIVGKIFKVPKSVAESEYVKIVADQRHCDTLQKKWEILAVEYSPVQQSHVGTAFRVTCDEFQKWSKT